MLIINTACSNQELEEATFGVLNQDGSTRAELKEYIIKDLAPGTLQTVMEDGNMTDAERLIIEGVFSRNDIDYLSEHTSVVSLDLSKAFYQLGGDIIPRWIFAGDSILIDITLPENLTTIETQAFYGCTSLTNITLPETLTSIESAAFKNCTSLNNITLPENLTFIGEEAFHGCTSLTSVNLPGGLTELENNIFEGCSSLTNVEIESGITYIPICCFTDCISLKSISIPADVTTIKSFAFKGCTSLASLHCFKGLKTIGDCAFRACSSLTDIILPEDMDYIDNNAFLNCSSIKNLYIPKGLKEIRFNAFSACDSLKTVDIDEGVTFIGHGAFNGCPLEEITIPSSVTEIQDGIDWNIFPNIKKVVWKSSANVGDLTKNDNLYCWLILSRMNDSLPAYGANWKNVVVDGVAEDVKLPYHSTIAVEIPSEVKEIVRISCSIPFNVTFNRFGEIESYLDSQWKTIYLPFKPTSISHAEKGDLAPFDSDVKGVINFWLRELTPEGFIDVSSFEANHPYVIAMPNSSLYDERYNITGNVTFSAQNIDCSHLDTTAIPAVGTDYTMYPSKTYMDPTENIYVLSNEWFINNSDNIYPYEAYAQSNTRTLRSALSLNFKRFTTRAIVDRNLSRKPQKDDM